jgi:Methylamine utilisation protein MauE
MTELARLGVGLVFVAAAALKALQFDLEAAHVAAFLGVSDTLASYLLAPLVAMELLLAVLVVAPRHGGWLSLRIYGGTLLVLAAFSVTIGVAAILGRPDCGCFGPAIEMAAPVSLLKNLLLAGLVAWLYSDAKRVAAGTSGKMRA